jgi:hypothetical protein
MKLYLPGSLARPGREGQQASSHRPDYSTKVFANAKALADTFVQFENLDLEIADQTTQFSRQSTHRLGGRLRFAGFLLGDLCDLCNLGNPVGDGR